MLSNLATTAADVPFSGLVPLALLTVLGVVLWAAGQRVLKAGMVTLGLLVGACIGWILGTEIETGIHPGIPTAVGAIGVAAMAALTYRLAIAGALAIVLGVAGPLGVLTVAEFQGRYDRVAAIEELRAAVGDEDEAEAAEEQSAIDEFERWLRPPDPEPEEAETEGILDTFDDEAETTKRFLTLRSVVDGWIGAGQGWWDGTPSELRPAIVLSAVIGTVLGVLLGALAPAICSVAVTSAGGSLVWIGGARSLLGAAGLAEGPWMPHSSRMWLIIWVVISILGLGIQWTLRPKPTDKTG